MASSSSGGIPNITPSQVAIVNADLPINKLLDHLIKNQRLLQSLPQNYKKKQSFTTLFHSLLDDYFYSHERDDVQLYAAICLADIIRIWAPNLPETSMENQSNMFLFLARQLLGLKNIDDPLFTQRYYLLENLSMVQSFIPAVNLENNRDCQISTIVLNNIFEAVQKNHTDQLKNLMIDIITVILAEYETIPFALLEILFAKLIEPEKKLREECYELAQGIIRRGENYLKTAIAQYFKTVLVVEEIESLQLHSKIYYVFDELCHISESIVEQLIPSIEHRLTVSNEKHRRDAAKIIAYVTSSSKNDFARKYPTLWNKFLYQFQNGTPEIQSTCIKYLRSYFVNHPELRSDLEEVMVRLSLSTDGNIRSQLMAQIRAITSSNLLEISEKIKQILCERARDKIWEVRKEALDYLGHVYKKECVHYKWSDDIQKQLTWVANCIIHLYYQKAIEDKLLAERLLTFYLIPWDGNIDDKVRVILTLYSNVDENAQRAIREIIHNKFLFRRQLIKLIDFCFQLTNSNLSNDEKRQFDLKLVNLIHLIASRYLPNSNNSQSILKAFTNHAIKTHQENHSSILSIFKQALTDGIKAKEVYTFANGIGQMLLEEQKRSSEKTTDGQYTKMCGLIKMIFEKISTILIDQETINRLLKVIFEKISNEPEQSMSFYGNLDQLWKVFIQHPFIFNSSEALELLCNFLKQHVVEFAPTLIRTIEACAPYITKSMISLLETELSSYLTLHPPIAKRALYCICALHPEKKDEFLQKIIDETQYDQFDNEQFITRLVLLGHMIQISPNTVGDLGKRILSNISKTIINQSSMVDDEERSNLFSHGHFTLLPDEPHADPEISADTRVKRELIKSMTRAVLGLREKGNQLFHTVYKLIRKCIEIDQEFTAEMNENEIIYIRLCGVSCLLKLIRQTCFHTLIKPDDFLMMINLLRDPSTMIRQRIYRKITEHLRDPLCPIELLALLAFAAKEPERDYREQIRRLMLQTIDTRREHFKLQSLSLNESNDEDEQSIDWTIYPEYSLTYFIYFLSKSPAFILLDDMEMLHTMADYLLFLLDSLLFRCDGSIGLFYRGLIRAIKSSEDTTGRLDREAKKDASEKLYVLADLTSLILTQRAPTLMNSRTNSHVSLPEMYYKKGRFNSGSYLPKDFQMKLQSISIPTTVNENEDGVDKEKKKKKKEKRKLSTNNRPSKKQKRSSSIPEKESNSSSSSINGKKSRPSKRSKINFSYEKPQLRSTSIRKGKKSKH